MTNFALKTGRATKLIRALLALGLLATGCGSTSTATVTSTGDLTVSPQNTAFLVGANRISVALQSGNRKPVLGANVAIDIVGTTGIVETRPLQFIGPDYGAIPVYIGVAHFPNSGSYRLVVHGKLADGASNSGQAYVTVTTKSPELPVGYPVPPLRQRIGSDVNGNLSVIDSGIPVDTFHTHTIADNIANHRPMVLYFGQPGHCLSATCGPTVQILQRLAQDYGNRFDFEHIEVHDPASSQAYNPVFVRFGLLSEPWVYLVNAAGVVADRFEGPLTIEQLRQAADGTLAGKVPAVGVR